VTTIANLLVNVGVDTKGASTGFAKVKSMAKVGALGLAAAGVAALKVAESFDDMQDTIIVGTGASGKALGSLEASAKRVGKTTPSSFADVGTAIADVNTRMGLTGKPLEVMSKKFLNLSRITGTDLAKNIEVSSRAFGDWGITMKDQPATLDKIFATSQSTGIGLEKLQQQVVTFGAPMRQFGFSFEESISLMGKFEKEGVNANAIFAGMKVGLGAISKAGKDPQKEFARISDAIKSAGSAGKANKIAIETFGQRAGPDMAAAIREGRFEIGDMVKALDKSGGAIDDADKRTRDWRESLAILRNKAMVLIEPLATKMFNAINDGADRLSKNAIPAIKRLVEDFRNGEGAFGAVKTVAGGMMKVLGAIGPPILGLAKAFASSKTAVLALIGAFVAYKAVMIAHAAVQAVSLVLLKAHTVGTIQHAVVSKVAAGAAKAWAVAQWLLNAAMSANPIGLIIIGLVALAAGLVLAYKKSETFRNIVNAAFSAVKKVAGAVITWLPKAVGKAVDFVKKHWRKIIAVLGGPLGIAVMLVVKHWDKIKSVTSGAIGKVVAFVKAIPGRFRSALSSLAGLVRGIFSNAMGKGLDVVRSIGDKIRDWIAAIPGKLASLGGKFASAGRGLLQQFIDGMKNAAGIISGIAGNVWTAVKGLLNGAIGRINAALNFSIGLPGKDLNINAGNIPYLAKGGIVTGPTLAVIGDNPGGREAVVPLSGPNARGLGGMNVTVNVNGAGDPRATAREVRRELLALKRQLGGDLGLA
jgi:TP901 family phage tail tape measure protein